MNVKFTDHAVKRCKQQKIDIGRLKKDISKMPPVNGRWATNYCVAICRVAIDSITVVTVISNRKYKRPHKGIHTY